MNTNYNDIIDIILTLKCDDEIINNIAISGSIVPYLVTNEESLEYHSDFYILVKNKKIDLVRSKIKALSKEYEFDIISDSKKYSKEDYGFKIKYQTTTVGFFPYSLIDDELTIKTYAINNDNTKISLKKKIIPSIKKSSVIRYINFSNGKIRIVSPEFIMADKQSKEKQPGNPTGQTMYLLDKICDQSVLRVVRQSVSNTVVKINTKQINDKKNYVQIIILSAIVIILLIIAYICFKK